MNQKPSTSNDFSIYFINSKSDIMVFEQDYGIVAINMITINEKANNQVFCDCASPQPHK